MTHHNRMTGDKLAALLGMPRRRLYELRALEGAPATFSEAAWRKFLAARHEAGDAEDAAENGAPRDDEDAGPSTPALKAAKLREEVRKLTIGNDARDKRLKEQWRQIGIDAASSILRRARGGLLGLLPDRIAVAAAGRDASEIKLVVRREVEAVLEESLRSETAPA